jgi:hypothetical protein
LASAISPSCRYPSAKAALLPHPAGKPHRRRDIRPDNAETHRPR